jgi:hypothetical protein
VSQDINEQEAYQRRLAAEGTPGSATAKDGRWQIHSTPCPDDRPRYLSLDGHMWLPLDPPYNLQVINAILEKAFPPPKRREK